MTRHTCPRRPWATHRQGTRPRAPARARRRKLGEAPLLNAVASLPPPPLPPQPLPLFLRQPDLSRLTLSGGSDGELASHFRLPKPQAGNGCAPATPLQAVPCRCCSHCCQVSLRPLRRYTRARIGRGGRLIIDRCRAFAFEPQTPEPLVSRPPGRAAP